MEKLSIVLASLVASVAFFAGVPTLCDAQESADALWGDRMRRMDDDEVPMPTLTKIVVEDFEDAAVDPWRASMPYNDGVAETRIAQSSSSAGRALGFRVLFMRRGYLMLDLRPSRPIRIEDDCRGFSIRAYGNGIAHELRLLLLDYYGNEFELSFGSLGHLGWKKLELVIPRRDGASVYAQDDRHYRDPAGLRVSGLRVAFDPMESYGEYIAFVDDLDAIVDRREAGANGGAAVAGVATGPAPAEAPSSAPGGAAADRPALRAEKLAKATSIALAEITRRIAKSMKYPEAARRRGIEGSMTLSFRVGENGELVAPRVEKSSGSDILDRSGLELLAGAFPVPNDSGLELDMSLPIVFRLEDAARD